MHSLSGQAGLFDPTRSPVNSFAHSRARTDKISGPNRLNGDNALLPDTTTTCQQAANTTTLYNLSGKALRVLRFNLPCSSRALLA
jgi:hypothetical protein